mgnify:CR=1 FL=1
MKAIVLIFSLLFLTAGFSQSEKFEGKVTFTFKYEGADMSAYDAYLQKSTTYFFKGKDVRFEMQGGMASLMGSILMDGDERIAYTINDLQKTAFIMDRDTADNQTVEADPNIEITATTITEVILGYTCKKYQVKDKAEGTTMFVWLTTELDLINPETFGGASAGLFFPGTQGVMLQMESTMPMGNGEFVTATQTATEILQTPQDASLFEIPAGYEIKEFDPASMLGGGMGGY